MKALPLILLGVFSSGSGASAKWVTWSSEAFSDFRDSFGNPLDETFIIQLGFFEDVLGTPFTPDKDNVSDWITQWRVFDQASLNLSDGFFSAEAGIDGSGASTSQFADNDLGLNFSYQDAYIWIRNSDTPGPGAEWFLARSSEWVLPPGSEDCCDKTTPVQWSITDLNPQSGTPVTPVWGGQSGQYGEGERALTDPAYTLQTFTFIPEPSSSLLVALAAGALLLRRGRPGRPAAE
jgi:hypothetical protein